MCNCCGYIGGHHPRCPYYKDAKSHSRYCSECGDPILYGEEYIENDDRDCIHYECVQGLKWLLSWLGYNVKEVTDYD